MSKLTDWRINRRRRDTHEVVKHVESKEVLADDWLKRLERIEQIIDSFAGSQEFVLPKAFQELNERVAVLEDEPVEIVSVEPAELQESIDELGQELGSMSGAILQKIVTLQKRADAQDARFAELPTVLAQLQKERRAG